MEPQLCSACHFALSETFYFCPNCGKRIKEPPMSAMKQIGIYALSILLPPLGLVPGIRYLLQKDQKVKTIGIVAIILTIISTVITLWFTMTLFNQLNQTMNIQKQQIQDLGL